MVQLKDASGEAYEGRKDYFNSFMVQLKADTTQSQGVCSWFQFLHGTIKRTAASGADYNLSLFQFLHGTIKRSAGFELRQAAYLNFNSFMVQLKAFILEDDEDVLGNFNSFMVQLKASYGLVGNPLFINFNSFMVQLKDT